MNGLFDRLHLALAWLKRQAIGHLTAIWIFLPVTVLALALAGYGWWWQVVADNMRSSVALFQSEQTSLGREVKWDSFDVQGFPYRVMGTLSAMHLTVPERGAFYDGERIVVHLEPFALNRMALSLEGQQRIFYTHEQWIEATARADKSLVTLSGEREGSLFDEVRALIVCGSARGLTKCLPVIRLLRRTPNGAAKPHRQDRS